jgi:hypothetical protein
MNQSRAPNAASRRNGDRKEGGRPQKKQRSASAADDEVLQQPYVFCSSLCYNSLVDLQLCSWLSILLREVTRTIKSFVRVKLRDRSRYLVLSIQQNV